MDTEHLIETTFNAHQPIIGRYGRANAENFANVYRFVLATIQQPLFLTPNIVADFKTNGSASRYAFAGKATGLDWIEENMGYAYDTAMFLGDYGNAALLSYFASLPGLGLIKGGFLAQLVFGEIGCIDTHNIARFGLHPRQFGASRFKAAKTAETRKKHVREYLATCGRCGGAALLWAEWCQYVANRDKRYESAQEVSLYHLKALGLKEKS